MVNLETLHSSRCFCRRGSAHARSLVYFTHTRAHQAHAETKHVPVDALGFALLHEGSWGAALVVKYSCSLEKKNRPEASLWGVALGTCNEEATYICNRNHSATFDAPPSTLEAASSSMFLVSR